MIDQAFSRMRPLYEAMSVCSSALEWLEREEQKHEDYAAQACIAGLVKAIEEFVDFVRANPLVEVQQDTLAGLVWCVSTLNSMTQLVVRKARGRLPQICEEFREATRLLLNQLDFLTVRIEDVLEAWQMGANQEFLKAADDAIASIDRSTHDVPDWRKTLESISD
jgi:hypothetical protein